MTRDYSKYLKRHLPFTDYDVSQISKSRFIVVIPVYLEDKLMETIQSLQDSIAIEEGVAVLLVFNASEKSDSRVLEKQCKTISDIKSMLNANIAKWNIHFHIIETLSLPAKHFGAGLARKIGMDTAIRSFYHHEIEDGVIISLDADSIVDKNYFNSLQDFFNQKENDACSIYFEHPLDEDQQGFEISNAIAKYELHLRYYVETLSYIGLPYAFHTVGSCLACTADAYVRVGGMNRRQGGEEFYFIQKLIQFGNYKNLNTSRVIPSSRISNRVPFGTGPSVKKILEEDGEYFTYNLQAFLDLKELIDRKENYYLISADDFQKEVLNLPGRVRSFLLNSDFFQEVTALSNNCSSKAVFLRRFFEIFNAFKVVKYVNYIHEHFISRVPVFDAAIELLERLEVNVDDVFDEKELLQLYRDIQKQR